MKKLLGIVVLGLLLSGNAYAEEIVLNCKVKFVSYDGKVLDEDFSETIILNIKKKQWKHSWTKKGSEKVLLVEDDYFASYSVDNYEVYSKSIPYIGAGYKIINRYDGTYTHVDTLFPVDTGKKFQKLKKKGKHNKALSEIKKIALNQYTKINYGTFTKYDCAKSKKQF